MPIAVYPALVTGDRGEGYRADLVDFAEAVVHGPDPAALFSAARERLGQELAACEREGRDWPEPTAVEVLQPKGATVLLVDVQVEETPVRVNISIGERLLRRLDEAANAQNMTRSGFIAAAVRQRLGDATLRGDGASSQQRIYDEVNELGRRLNEALGPESAFGRTLTELDARALDGLRVLADRLGGRRRKP